MTAEAFLLHRSSARDQALPIGATIVAIFVGGCALAAVGLGPLVRLVFPVLCLLIAAWLLVRQRSGDYIALTLWLFFLTPTLRRVIDLQAGWSVVNTVMIAPYAAGVLCALPVARLLREKGYAYSAPFAVVFACVLYGFTLGALDGQLVASLFDVLRWSVPPCFGLFIALQPQNEIIHRKVIVRTMSFGVLFMSCYGIYQYVSVPAWDALWMRESQLTTIGFPEPFLVRVFSTMNGPGSFASYLSFGLLLLTSTGGRLRIPSLLVGFVAMALTLVRTSWLGVALGMLVLFLFGASRSVRLGIVACATCLPVILVGLESIPEISDIISRRIDTLVTVQSDDSFLDRSMAYHNFLNIDLPDAPFGTGFATNGAYQSYISNRPAKIVDGAVIEIGMTLGSFAGSAYILAVLIIMAAASRAGLRSGDPFLSVCGAFVIVEAATLTGGMVTIGEIGIPFWTSIGFCLMARGTERSRVALQSPA